MRFFKRGAGPAHEPLQDRITAFWAWWPTVSDGVAASISDGSVQRWVEPISGRVQAMDRRLAWELSAGVSAQHALVVTPEGDPAVRPTALAWRAAAPSADARWEYHASRQPGPPGRLQIAGVDFDLADFRAIASWDAARERVDVQLWHPAVQDAPGDAGLRAGFLFLDNLLGEDDVERWIGTIDLLPDAISGRTPQELAAEVRRRAASASGGTWSLGTLSSGGQDGIAAVDLSIKPIDHPYCQDHLTVTIARGTEHLAGAGETEAVVVNAAEDVLAEALAAIGGVHLGRITRRRDRIIHFMVPDPEAARGVATGWATDHPALQARVAVTHDPGWKVRGELGF
jgi:hypothetical protein